MLNKVIIMGRLTADPELRTTTSGISACRFTVACERNFVQQGQERQTDFISVVAWRKTAEFVNKYFSKGSMIVIEGNLRTGSFNDKKYPDVKHYTTEVYADQIYFGESKKAEQPNAVPTQNVSSGEQASSSAIAIGNLSEFEEIISDGQLPF